MAGIYKIMDDVDANTKHGAVLEQAIAVGKANLVHAEKAAQRLVALKDEHSLEAEKFRMLANRLAALRVSRQLRVVHVTSSVVGEGKSLVSANLAFTLARRPNERVLLLEGDLRKPSLAGILGVRNTPDIAGWWNGKRETAPVPYAFPGVNLCFLPAGAVQRPTDVLESPRLPALLAEFARQFDWVIIDSPPLMAVADSSLLARYADGTIIVVRSGVATKKAVQKGLESLDEAKLIGFVMNDSADRQRSYYYYNYYGDNGCDGNGKRSVPDKRR